MSALLGKEIYLMRRMVLVMVLVNGVRMRKFSSLIFGRLVILIGFLTVSCKSLMISVGEKN